VSPHDADVIYHTSQYVHRTRDEGVTWEIISPDLTAFEKGKQVISGSPITRDITGEEFYSTIYAIRESSIKKGVIWTGANDGPVHVTTDDGKSWKNVTPSKLPSGGRVDAVEPSPHDPAKAYIAVLRYQLGDRSPYIYKTINYGKSWTLISDGTNGIASDNPVRVIREHPKRAGLLFAGTEEGLFVSFDDGGKWQSFQQNLPVTPITDIKIHEDDIVMSTMGRGFWIGDNISTLVKLDLKTDKAEVFIAEKTVRNKRTYMRIDSKSIPQFENPSTLIDYYLPNKSETPVKLEILDANQNLVNTYFSDTTGNKMKPTIIDDMNTNRQLYLVDKSLTNKKGFNRFTWDMTHMGPWHKSDKRRYKSGPIVKPGTYTAKLYVGEDVIENMFELLPDPRLAATNTTIEDIEAQNTIGLKIATLVSEARIYEDKLNKELKVLKKKDKLEEADKMRKESLESLISQLRKKDIIYPQPKLIDQIEYLYNMVNGADQMMGKDVYDRYEELYQAYSELKK
jgi:hypothetical protein